MRDLRRDLVARQVEGVIHFKGGQDLMEHFDTQIKDLCTQVNDIVERMRQKGIPIAAAI